MGIAASAPFSNSLTRACAAPGLVETDRDVYFDGKAAAALRQDQAEAESPRQRREKAYRGTATDFQPALAIEPFASPFLGPVEPVFLEAERRVRRVA